jgi:hypothetical protein
MEFDFSNPIFEWRGPAPFYFIELPAHISAEIAAMSKQLSYGWGVIPIAAVIGQTSFTTSLFPKNGGYLLPLKDAVRKPARLKLGDEPLIKITVSF